VFAASITLSMHARGRSRFRYQDGPGPSKPWGLRLLVSRVLVRTSLLARIPAVPVCLALHKTRTLLVIATSARLEAHVHGAPALRRMLSLGPQADCLKLCFHPHSSHPLVGCIRPHFSPSFKPLPRPQAAGHDSPHFCTDPLMATLAHFETDADLTRRIRTLFQVTGAGGSRAVLRHWADSRYSYLLWLMLQVSTQTEMCEHADV
jgi:hypothetical protein